MLQIKILVLVVIFTITSSICYTQTVLNHNVNSGSGSYNKKNLSVDYVIGDMMGSMENSSFSSITIPLANLIDSTTGIFTLDDVYLKVFPNPVTSHIILSTSQADNYEISLLDILSDKVAILQTAWIEENTEIILPIEDLAISSGAYFLRITSKPHSNNSQHIATKPVNTIIPINIVK